MFFNLILQDFCIYQLFFNGCKKQPMGCACPCRQYYIKIRFCARLFPSSFLYRNKKAPLLNINILSLCAEQNTYCVVTKLTANETLFSLSVKAKCQRYSNLFNICVKLDISINKSYNKSYHIRMFCVIILLSQNSTVSDAL